MCGWVGGWVWVWVWVWVCVCVRPLSKTYFAYMWHRPFRGLLGVQQNLTLWSK